MSPPDSHLRTLSPIRHLRTPIILTLRTTNCDSAGWTETESNRIDLWSPDGEAAKPKGDMLRQRNRWGGKKTASIPTEACLSIALPRREKLTRHRRARGRARRRHQRRLLSGAVTALEPSGERQHQRSYIDTALRNYTEHSRPLASTETGNLFLFLVIH